jgi:serine/threonine protein kinase
MENLVATTTIPDHALPVGAILNGTYRIVRPLAEGGCGEVYVGAHTRLPGEFAIKVLRRTLVEDSEAASRFRREAEITSEMRHPHVVQVFDFNVTDEGVPYLVMELLDGQLLAKRVADGGPVDPRTAVRIVEQIAGALSAAHARGIVHRDLKPDNVILLSVDGQDDFVKLVDFGISQASWRPRLTGDTHVVGTPQFMAPEQARGQREVIDARTDQFSLAAIAYTLLTGSEPFWGDDLTAVLYQVVYEPPVPPSRRAPWLGAAVDAVLARGLAKSSGERYPDILSFARALRDAVGDAVVPPEYATARDAQLSTMDATTQKLPRYTRVMDRGYRTRRASMVLAVLALAAAVLVLSPQAGQGARVAWQRAEVELERAATRALRTGTSLLGRPAFARPGSSSSVQEFSRSAPVSMP